MPKRVTDIEPNEFKKHCKSGEPGRRALGRGIYLVIDERDPEKPPHRYFTLRLSVNGHRHEYGLGSLEDTSLGQARDLAGEYRDMIKRGERPGVRGKPKPVVVPTFKQAATQCIAEHVKGLTNAKAQAQWTNTLAAYVYPVFGSKPVDQIEQRDVLRALSPIWVEKQETASRVRQRIEKVLHWAKAHGMRSGDNPADKALLKNVLPAQIRTIKRHAALPWKRLPGFVIDLRESPAERATKFAFEFLILTVCRVQEVVEGPVVRDRSGRPRVDGSRRAHEDEARPYRTPQRSHDRNLGGG